MKRCVLLAAILLAAASLAHADPPPAKGMFLVASRDLHDPNFARTVVLLLDYDAGGALGLVINRPSSMGLAETLPEIEGLGPGDGPIWTGGPVARGKMMMLLRRDGPLEDTETVVPGVRLSRSRDLLEELAEERSRGTEFRVYAGYSGWGPGQLDGELDRGGWHVVPADAETVFAAEPAGIWERLLPPEPAMRARVADSPGDRSLSLVR
jgi:putative transcriptional regulator